MILISLSGRTMMKSPLLLAVVYFALLAVTLVTLPAGAARAQGSADVSLEQQIQAALANAGFDPGPADGKFGPKTRTAIQEWQRANGHTETGYLTRDQLRSILTETATAVLEPKCAELPSQYLKNHSECWDEIANQPGCYWWNRHYHSDQTTDGWSGRCHRGIAEGRGTLSLSAGWSGHASSYEGMGTLSSGNKNGHWTEAWASGIRYEGEYRDGLPHGYATLTFASGTRYEGEWRNGCYERDGKRAWFTSAAACGFE